MKEDVPSVRIVDFLSVYNMAKYLLTIPVYGTLNIIIDAENDQDVLSKYEEQKEELLKWDNGLLTDDLSTAYVIEINKKKIC